MESAERLERGVAPVQNPELITVRREDLKLCLEAMIKDVICNGGLVSQLGEKYMTELQGRALQ